MAEKCMLQFTTVQRVWKLKHTRLVLRFFLATSYLRFVIRVCILLVILVEPHPLGRCIFVLNSMVLLYIPVHS